MSFFLNTGIEEFLVGYDAKGKAMELESLLKKVKKIIKIIPSKHYYHKLRRFIEDNPQVSKLFSSQDVRAHYGSKPVRDNIFFPDLFITQLRYFRMYEYFKKYYSDIFYNSTTVLDVGDSSGIFLKALGKTGDALNIDKDTIERINSKGIKAYHGSIYNLPYANKAYDYVMSFQCLEHLDSPLQGLKELTRVAKKRVFVSIPYREKTVVYNKDFWQKEVRLSQEDGGWGLSDINESCDYHIFELSTADFLNLVSYTNFVCKRNFPINYFIPLGQDIKNRGSYFNFFDLEPAD